jgi:hypothetical protein
MRKQLLFLASMLLAIPAAFSQTLPTNIDFETGTLSDWMYYTGTCCPISTGAPTGPITGRHTLTSGTGTDPYGGFPVVAPYAGNYSFKLGDNAGLQQSERVRYYVHVPATSSDYSLIYHFAAVLEDAGHLPAMEPSMQITAFDSATGMILPCDSLTYIGYATTPGFLHTGVTGSDVIYRPWSMGSMRMYGYGGHTIAVDFATGDCGYGGHFGYGYVDISDRLFITAKTLPCGSMDTLDAPPGYQAYSWRDSATFATVYGSSQTVVLSMPSSATMTYAVILTPYPGYGCPDTLYTRVTVALPCPSLGVFSANAGNDMVTVSPNPAADELTIQLGSKWFDAVSVSNQVGTVVMEQPIKMAETKLNISSLAPGVYFATLKGPNGNEVRRFVKM